MVAVAGESDVQFAVRNVSVDRFDVGLLCAASFLEHIEIFELMTFDIERKHALARSANSFEGFRKMKPHLVFAVGNFHGE